MAGITGIGSGMDIDSIVSAMVTAEKTPKQNQLNTVEKKATTQLTSLGQLKGAISTFQTALAALNSSSSFLARSVTASDAKVLTPSASQSAAAGTYQVSVSQLAVSSKVALAAVPADSTKTLSSGTLEIKVGSTTALKIDVGSGNNTLAGIRDAINKSGAGVTASIVTDDKGARLTLTSNKAGDGNDITVKATNVGTDGDSSLSLLTFNGSAGAPVATDYAGGEGDADYQAALQAFNTASGSGSSGKVIAEAKSAQLTIDGLSITRDSNSIDGAIEGVSFNLLTTGTSNLTVARDEAGVKSKVQSFVDAYNTMMGFINTQTKVTTVTDNDAPVVGALVGDSSVRALVNVVRNELVAAQDGTVKVLTNLGITTQQDGTLKVDSDKLGKAISNDYEGVAKYFTGDSGLAARLGNKLKAYTETDGILEQRTDMLQATLDKVDKQNEDLTTRMNALSERLYKQFNAMDSLVAQLTNTSNSLTSLFENMPGFVTSKE
ncbi:flagellar filament capping protein FliD [Pseudomonas sp. LS44]|uniref:flagellar filament capping protein FliD n=1 Tax=Pseudomonas sp. LS44 TaxID=1357074 RepID=UPI00215A6457|nr:flagellar filament capping protein FliD [Pseudomonas sp. LS44]UVE16383.1 flagellar filament capping protein FliD [Pseudomonas sp. LS44]